MSKKKNQSVSTLTTTKLRVGITSGKSSGHSNPSGYICNLLSEQDTTFLSDMALITPSFSTAALNGRNLSFNCHGHRTIPSPASLRTKYVPNASNDILAARAVRNNDKQTSVTIKKFLKPELSTAQGLKTF